MAYKKGDYAKYHKSPRMIKERSIRTQNRRKAIRTGRVKKGDGTHIDHVDGDKLNNNVNNLRFVNPAGNQLNANRKMNLNNTSGIKGIGFYTRNGYSF